MRDAGTERGLEALIGELSISLSRIGYWLVTAESCTGGLIAALCTDVAGSSGWFKGGVVAYANELKENLLGVPAEGIREHGAVSGPVVRHMALGALARCGADAAIAVSGVAGPGGGLPEKPVGTVWIAVALRERPGLCAFDLDALSRRIPGCSRETVDGRDIVVQVLRHHFEGDRAAVRRGAAERGLSDLAVLLEQIA
ncbi:MAG: CinA family protein [Deltaproteobacteria bacterium]|jgi:nicotinamide-nucleotide amidase|nr:CinA family protein [Deltaproteobacteria bacterium]